MTTLGSQMMPLESSVSDATIWIITRDSLVTILELFLKIISRTVATLASKIRPLRSSYDNRHK
jgi:hypothetical protein